MRDKEKEREYKRASTEFFRAHGICTTCGKNRAAPGRAMCLDCLQKSREYHYRKLAEETPEQREHRLATARAYHRRTRAERRAQGLCTECGRPTAQGTILCLEHLLRRRRQERERRQKEHDPT